ncbi:MAG TPA: type 4a pilus biogenesis protein PilO [Candidatus Paceibacterota bacterium]
MKFLFPFIAIIVAIGVFFGYVNPKYQDSKVLQAQQAQFDDALAKSRDLRTIRDEKLKTYNSFTPTDLDRLEKLLPDHVDNIRLVMDLDNMAAHYGMRVTNVLLSSPTDAASSPEVTGSPFGSLTITFSVTSSYDTFLKYLADLESSLRLVDLVSLSFNSSNKDLNEYTLSLRTYWLR